DGRAIEAGAGCALVPDLAHHFAAAVLVERRAEVAAEAVPETAQLRIVVAAHVEPAQLHHAAAVLQLLAHAVEEGRGPGQRKVVAGDPVPVESLGRLERAIDLLQDGSREQLHPAVAARHLGAVPDANSFEAGWRDHERSGDTVLGRKDSVSLRRLSTGL